MLQKVYISRSKLGLGVFAKVPLQSRETLFFLTGKLICFEDAVASAQGEYAIQIGMNRYIDPHSPARYLNHSCEPNAGFVDEIRLIALRPIRPGEEIRFDYSTTMLERYWELDCSCGSSGCRRRIRDFDLLPLARQRFYLHLGIVQDFILREIGASVVPEQQMA